MSLTASSNNQDSDNFLLMLTIKSLPKRASSLKPINESLKHERKKKYVSIDTESANISQTTKHCQVHKAIKQSNSSIRQRNKAETSTVAKRKSQRRDSRPSRGSIAQPSAVKPVGFSQRLDEMIMLTRRLTIDRQTPHTDQPLGRRSSSLAGSRKASRNASRHSLSNVASGEGPRRILSHHSQSDNIGMFQIGSNNSIDTQIIFKDDYPKVFKPAHKTRRYSELYKDPTTQMTPIHPTKSKFRRLINIKLLTQSWYRQSLSRQTTVTKHLPPAALPPLWKTQGHNMTQHRPAEIAPSRNTQIDEKEWEKLRHCRYLRPGPAKYWSYRRYLYSDLT